MMIPRRSGMSFAHVFEASLLQTLSALISVAQASHSLCTSAQCLARPPLPSRIPQSRWRNEALDLLHGSGAGSGLSPDGHDAAASATASALQDVIGVLPAEAVPSTESGGTGGGTSIRHAETGALLIDLPAGDATSEDENGAPLHVKGRSASLGHHHRRAAAGLVTSARRRGRSAGVATAALLALRRTLIGGARRVIPRRLQAAFAAGRGTSAHEASRDAALPSTASGIPVGEAGASMPPSPQTASVAAMVPSLLHRSILGWRSEAAQRVQLNEGLDAEAINTLFRLGAFLVHTCGSRSSGGGGSTTRTTRGRFAVASAPEASASGAAAKRVQAEERARRLLPFLAWLPVRAFSVPTMAAALEVWQWVLGTCPVLRVPLLAHVVAAWRWTIDMRFGLFSGGTREDAASAAPPAAGRTSDGPQSTPAMPSDFVAPPEPEGLSERVARATLAGATVHAPLQWLPPGLSDPEPHRFFLQVRTWVGRHPRRSLARLHAPSPCPPAQLFEERCRQSRSSSGEELALLAQAVLPALADATRLSARPAAFGPRVRLVHLGMCVLQAAHVAQGAPQGGQAPGAPPAAGPLRRGSSFGVGSTVGLYESAVPTPRLGMVGATFADPATPGALAAARDAADARGGGGADDDSVLWDDSTTVVSGSQAEHEEPPAAAAAAAVVAAPGLFAAAEAPAGGAAVFSGERWAGVSAGSLACLRERLYRAALAWFALAPSRYEVATSPQVVRQDFPYVVSLCRLIQVCVWGERRMEEG